jgi:hypothetical protein
LYHNCSVHADSISYTNKFVNREESSVCGQLSFLPRLKDGGLQKGMLDDILAPESRTFGPEV